LAIRFRVYAALDEKLQYGRETAALDEKLQYGFNLAKSNKQNIGLHPA
jgi:hypothetical protein